MFGKIQWIGAVVTFSITLSVYSQESEISADSFAYGARLTNGDSSIRKVHLKAEVIRDLSHRRAADIRVFDSSGRVMPARVSLSASKKVEDIREIEFFPLTQSAVDAFNSIEVIRDENKEIERLVSNVKNIPGKDHVTGYLFDLGEMESQSSASLQAVRINWEDNKASDLIPVLVEHSRDLDQWRRVTNNTTLSSLWFKGKSLTRNELELPSSTARFIRLTFLDRKKRVTINRVAAVYRQTNTRPLEWLSIGPLAKKEEDHTYSFILPRGVAPTMMRLVLPLENQLVSGTLYMRNNKKKWIIKNSDFSQYRVNTDNGQGVMESKPFVFHGPIFPEWRFVSDGDDGIEAAVLPEVEIAYANWELIFLAQGTEPYRMVWGNNQVDRQAANIDAVLKDARAEGKTIDRVEAGAREMLKGERATSDVDPDWWQKWALWVVLTAGVLIVTRMAYQLFKEIND